MTVFGVILFFPANGGFQVFLGLQQSWNNQKPKNLAISSGANYVSRPVICY
jgi:hypothetical protein